jgi:hypothetical protein
MSSIALAKAGDLFHAVPSYGWRATRRKVIFYAYILESVSHPREYYRGHALPPEVSTVAVDAHVSARNKVMRRTESSVPNNTP